MAFDKTQPYATVNTDAGRIYYLQSGVLYNSSDLSAAATPPAPVDADANSNVVLFNSQLLTKVNKTSARVTPSATANLMLMGNVNHTGASIGASDLIMDSEHPALGSFYAVKLTFSNYDTSAVLTIDGAVAGPCPTHVTTAGNTITWTTVTFNGGSASVAIPAATTGPGGDVIPGIVISDICIFSSIARTDTPGRPPLIRCRAHVLANAVVYTMGGGGPTGNAQLLSNASINPYLQYGAYNFADTLAHLQTATSTVLEPNALMLMTGVQPYYATAIESIDVYGDSIFQGSNSEVSSFCNWGNHLMFTQFSTSRQISCGNYGVSGQKTWDSIAIMKAHVLAGARPTYVAMKWWSINDGTTTAVFNKSWAYFIDALEFLRSYGITPVAMTAPPANGVAGAPWTTMKTFNTKLMALPDWVLKCDIAAYLNDPANDGHLLASVDYGDHTHWLDAGHIIAANAVFAVLPLP